MAAAGTLTKSTDTATATSNYALVYGYHLLVVSEDSPTGPKEIARFKHPSEASATEKAFEAQKAGFSVQVEEVFVRDR